VEEHDARVACRWAGVASGGLALLLAIALLPAILRLHDVTYAVLAVLGASP
jgi:hypothetical protein